MSVPENNEVWILAFYDTNNSHINSTFHLRLYIIVISKHFNFFIVLVSFVFRSRIFKELGKY